MSLDLPQRQRRLPRDYAMLGAIGAIGGLLSGLLGVGGGVIMVPLFTLWAGYSQRLAHAMSLTAIIPISIGGIVTYGGAGAVNPMWAACLVIGSIAGAQIGARLLARAKERPLKLAFGGFLIVAAIVMVLR